MCFFGALDESSRGRLSASGFRDWGLGFMVMIPEGPYTLPLWNLVPKTIIGK